MLISSRMMTSYFNRFFSLWMNRAAGGIVHFQQAMDGGSAVVGQLAQPLGGAARGGAEGDTRSDRASYKLKMALTVVVLPVPGPPVSTMTRLERAKRMASFCKGAY